MSPSMSPSSSIASSTNSSIQPPPSIKKLKKRPLSSEIVIKIMDKCLLKEQLRKQQLEYTLKTSRLGRSASLNTYHNLLDRAVSGCSRLPQKHTTKKSKVSNPQQTTLIAEWPYVLIQDNEEQDRMVAQHYLLRTAFGGDFSLPIRSQLQKGIIVLDVGCGPGTWTMEMATAFPKSTFIGIDQSSFFPKDIKPKNCHFRTCSKLVPHQLSLPFPDNSIDYIYQRDMSWGLMEQTWHPLLKEYLRILKPGGWIEVVEQDLETQSSPENVCNMNDDIIKGLTIRMQDPYTVLRLPTMLTVHGFKQIQSISRSCPLGWEESSESTEGEEPKCSEFARAMSGQQLFLLRSLRPWLSVVMNMNYEKYDEYIATLPAQWTRAKTCINWHSFTAQKPLL